MLLEAQLAEGKHHIHHLLREAVQRIHARSGLGLQTLETRVRLRRLLGARNARTMDQQCGRDRRNEHHRAQGPGHHRS